MNGVEREALAILLESTVCPFRGSMYSSCLCCGRNVYRLRDTWEVVGHSDDCRVPHVLGLLRKKDRPPNGTD